MSDEILVLFLNHHPHPFRWRHGSAQAAVPHATIQCDSLALLISLGRETLTRRMKRWKLDVVVVVQAEVRASANKRLPAGPARQPWNSPQTRSPLFSKHSGPFQSHKKSRHFENSISASLNHQRLTQKTTPIEEILLEDGQNVQDYRRLALLALSRSPGRPS